MKPFETVSEHLKSIGYKRNEHRFNERQLGLTLENVLTILLLCSSLFSVTQTPEEFINSVLLAVIAILVFVSRLSTVYKTAAIFAFIDELSDIITQRINYAASKQLIEKTHEFVEKCCEIAHLTMELSGVLGYILPKAIVSYFIYFATDANQDAFNLSIPMWFPFDWQNPIGYLVAVAVQLHMFLMLARYIECFFILCLAGLIFEFSFVEDIKNDLNLFDEIAINKKSKLPDIEEQLVKLIQFDVDLRQLPGNIKEVYSITLVVLFLGCTSAICLSLLMIQVGLTQAQSITMLFSTIIFGFCSTALAFGTCEIGGRLDTKLDEINRAIYQLKWYSYPLEVQRMLVPILIYTEKPAVIHFFGSFTCSREQFKKVMNSAYSYFMVLRGFYM